MQTMSDMGFTLINQLRKERDLSDSEANQESYLKVLSESNSNFESGIRSSGSKVSILIEDIQRMLIYTKPDKINLPDGYLVLGSLVGIVIKTSSDENTRLAAITALFTLRNIWNIYTQNNVINSSEKEFVKLLNDSIDGVVKYLFGWDYNE